MRIIGRLKRVMTLKKLLEFPDGSIKVALDCAQTGSAPNEPNGGLDGLGKIGKLQIADCRLPIERRTATANDRRQATA